MKSRTSQISLAAVTGLLVAGCAIAALIVIQSVRATGAEPASTSATLTETPSVIIQGPGIDPQILWNPVPCRTLFTAGPQPQAWELRLDFSAVNGLSDWCVVPQRFDSVRLRRDVPRIGMRGGFVRVAEIPSAAELA
jgi:hypothetical protein